MSFDVLSKKGREAVEQSRLGLALIPRQYVETSQDREGDIDGFFLSADGKEIAAAFETKARDMTLDKLRNSYNDEWILTFEKINKGSIISRSLCVPFFGVVYLIPDRITLLAKLTDDHGNIVAPVRLDVTETKANCNGGHAIRTNAYVSMKNAHLYRHKD